MLPTMLADPPGEQHALTALAAAKQSSLVQEILQAPACSCEDDAKAMAASSVFIRGSENTCQRTRRTERTFKTMTDRGSWCSLLKRPSHGTTTDCSTQSRTG